MFGFVKGFNPLYVGLAFSFVATVSALAGDDTLGRTLYETGEGDQGRTLTAYVGQASTALPASAMPCVGCHGERGEGKPEGGVIPSNIQWRELSKSYGVVSASGRKHPAYDRKTLARVLREGVDPAGQRLDTSMPRFDISDIEIDALLAYLQVIDRQQAAGVTDKAITVATLQQSDATVSASAVLEAYFREINAAGGLYGRELRLRTLTAAGTQQGADVLSAQLGAQGAFALLGVESGSADQAIAEWSEQQGIPNIAPYTQTPSLAGGRHYSFYLFGDRLQQLQSMVSHAQRQHADGLRMAVVTNSGDDSWRPLAEWARGQGPAALKYHALIPGEQQTLVQSLRTDAVHAVLYLGEGRDFSTLVQAMAAQGWSPDLYLPRDLINAGLLTLPSMFDRHVMSAYPLQASGESPEGLQRFREFHLRNRLSQRRMAAQLHAYAAAQLLVEAVKRSGRDLSRDTFIVSLEQLTRFNTGVVPPLSYSANRRVGSGGAYIVALDLQARTFGPAGQWIALDQ